MWPLVFFVLLLIPADLSAQNFFRNHRVALPSFISKSGANALLTEVLHHRCRRHFSGIYPELDNCYEAVNSMVRDLDQDFQITSRGQGGAAIFRTRLFELLRSTEVIDYLRALNEALTATPPSEPFNLWNLTLNHTHGDPIRALDWIAVLFQDTAANAHTRYLRGNLSFVSPEGINALDLLRNTNDLLATSDSVILFPSFLQSPARSQYHFFVIANLAKNLERSQPGSPFNKIVPFFFNASYGYARHIATSGPDIMTRDRWNELWRPWVFFDNQIYRDPLEDIYLGYAGAVWGVSLLRNNICPVDQSFFSARFAAEPELFIRSWMRNLGLRVNDEQ